MSNAQINDVLMMELHYLPLTMAFIVVGILAMEYVLSNRRLVKALAPLGTWLTGTSNLPSACAIAFITSVVSPLMASTMLATMYREGRLSRRGLYVASLVNALPTFISHLRVQLPVLIGTMGFYGLIYLSILLSISTLQTAISMVVGKAVLPPIRMDSEAEELVPQGGVKLSRVVRIIARALITVVIADLVIVVLDYYGIFNYLTRALTGLLPGLNPYVVSIVAAYMVSDNAAFAMAGGLLMSGYDGLAVINYLILGYTLSSVVRALRHHAPYYIGVYGLRDGMSILGLSTLMRVLLALLMMAIINHL